MPFLNSNLVTYLILIGLALIASVGIIFLASGRQDTRSGTLVTKDDASITENFSEPNTDQDLLNSILGGINTFEDPPEPFRPFLPPSPGSRRPSTRDPLNIQTTDRAVFSPSSLSDRLSNGELGDLKNLRDRKPTFTKSPVSELANGTSSTSTSTDSVDPQIISNVNITNTQTTFLESPRLQNPDNLNDFSGIGNSFALAFGSLLAKCLGAAIFGALIPLTVPSIDLANIVKECVLDIKARGGVIKGLVNSIADSYSDWALSGFDGKPAFIDNPQEWWEDVADTQLGHLLDAGGLGFLCDLRNLDLRFVIELRVAGIEQTPPRCKFSEALENINNFRVTADVDVRQRTTSVITLVRPQSKDKLNVNRLGANIETTANSLTQELLDSVYELSVTESFYEAVSTATEVKENIANSVRASATSGSTNLARTQVVDLPQECYGSVHRIDPTRCSGIRILSTSSELENAKNQAKEAENDALTSSDEQGEGEGILDALATNTITGLITRALGDRVSKKPTRRGSLIKAIDKSGGKTTVTTVFIGRPNQCSEFSKLFLCPFKDFIFSILTAEFYIEDTEKAFRYANNFIPPFPSLLNKELVRIALLDGADPSRVVRAQIRNVNPARLSKLRSSQLNIYNPALDRFLRSNLNPGSSLGTTEYTALRSAFSDQNQTQISNLKIKLNQLYTSFDENASLIEYLRGTESESRNGEYSESVPTNVRAYRNRILDTDKNKQDIVNKANKVDIVERYLYDGMLNKTIPLFVTNLSNLNNFSDLRNCRIATTSTSKTGLVRVETGEKTYYETTCSALDLTDASRKFLNQRTPILASRFVELNLFLRDVGLIANTSITNLDFIKQYGNNADAFKSVAEFSALFGSIVEADFEKINIKTTEELLKDYQNALTGEDSRLIPFFTTRNYNSSSILNK